MKKYKILSIIATLLISISVMQTIFTKAESKTKNILTPSEITMEVNSGRILFSDNADIKRPMASTTKIMTAITVIETVEDLEKEITIKRSYTGIEGSSIYLKEGEKLTFTELLYGLMLQSGNDCAEALACETSGSIEKFAELMNSFAKKLGCENTNFVNPHGLHNNNHYTTAYDLAKISCYAMKNELFKKIVSTKKIKISSPYSEYRLILNKNKMLKEYEGATGIKTGFTKKAGRCLVSSAIKDKMEVVCVVLGCPPMFERSKNLLDYSYNNYEYTELFNADVFSSSIKIKGTEKLCGLRTEGCFYYPLKKDEIDKVVVNIEYPEELEPPFNKNDIVGKIEIYYENQLLFSEKIYTIIGVKSKDFRYILKDIIDSWLVIK